VRLLDGGEGRDAKGKAGKKSAEPKSEKAAKPLRRKTKAAKHE
jgi:hypothetical protein